MSELVSIVYKPREAYAVSNASSSASEGGEYIRIPLSQTRLVVDYGIEGDAKGGSSTRQLNLMSANSLEQLAQEGFQTAPGQMGEQLIVANLEVDGLASGTRLQIGEQACVELTEPRTGCGKFERYQTKKREEAAGHLGMMARVVKEGIISVGDAVQVMDSSDRNE